MEGKLAETAPKRPLALTIGAAAATLVVILGILSGPAIVSCFNSEDGLGLCLRGKMADLGLVPPLPAPAVAEAETPEPEASAPVATTEEAVSAESELDVTPPAEALDSAAADGVIAATFGLLRAEPDGSVVIAGSGTPGSTVEIFANGDLLGTADVESSGDWAFVPDAPLAPGDLEITLGEEGKTGTAERAFIVVLNEDRTTQPLVVASTPGQASEVIQGLVAQPAETQVASAPEPATEPVATEAMSSTAEAEHAQETAVVAEAVPAVTASEPASADATPAVAEPASSDSAANVVTTQPAVIESQPVVAETEGATEPTAAEPEVATQESVVANAPEAATPAAPAVSTSQLADVQPTIDAIEIEGDRTFFAGSGPDKGVIRLYVDDAVIADTSVAEGRWLIEAGPVLDKPSQRVRIDLIQPDTGAVVARSEVDFVVDLPAGTDEPVVAEAEVPAIDTQPAAPAAETAASPATEEVPSTDAPTAPATEPAVPTMVAVSLGDPDAQRFASGKAIIRRGDNLWTIARRVYGDGVKYTTIYEANTGQIRDPDRIYPGQVFDLPKAE